MGLLRTAARASVAAHVVGNVQRKQQRRWAAEDAAMRAQAAPAPMPVQPVVVAAPAPPAPVAPAAPARDPQLVIDQLRQLGELRDAGVLTEAEFAAKKAMLLA